MNCPKLLGILDKKFLVGHAIRRMRYGWRVNKIEFTMRVTKDGVKDISPLSEVLRRLCMLDSDDVVNEIVEYL